jgi:hypothetical protein
MFSSAFSQTLELGTCCQVRDKVSYAHKTTGIPKVTFRPSVIFFWEGLRKIMKISGQDSRSPGPPEYEAGVLTTSIQRSWYYTISLRFLMDQCLHVIQSVQGYEQFVNLIPMELQKHELPDMQTDPPGTYVEEVAYEARRCVPIWKRRVVSYQLTDVSEVHTASIITEFIALIMEAVSTTETSVNLYYTTWRNKPEDIFILVTVKTWNLTNFQELDFVSNLPVSSSMTHILCISNTGVTFGK